MDERLRFIARLLEGENMAPCGLGAIVAAMSCAFCFPALGTLGATVALGFLAQFEGVFINTLLPVFAAIALAATLLAWLSHRSPLMRVSSITSVKAALRYCAPMRATAVCFAPSAQCHARPFRRHA